MLKPMQVKGVAYAKSLKVLIGEERQAASDYTKKAQQSSPRAARTFRHIAGEEKDHRSELKHLKAKRFSIIPDEVLRY